MLGLPVTLTDLPTAPVTRGFNGGRELWRTSGHGSLNPTCMVPELVTPKHSIEHGRGPRLGLLAALLCVFYVNYCRAYPTVFFIGKIICMYRLWLKQRERDYYATFVCMFFLPRFPQKTRLFQWKVQTEMAPLVVKKHFFAGHGRSVFQVPVISNNTMYNTL